MINNEIVLRHHTEIRIEPSKPFCFGGTVYKPSHFPLPVTLFANDKLWFSMYHANHIYGLRLEQDIGEDLRLTIFSEQPIEPNTVNTLADEVRYRFDLNLDLSEFMKMTDSDPLLGPVEQKWRGMRVSCPVSLYELLCITVVLQNTQVARSTKMLNSLLEAYGRQVIFDGQTLMAFWLPEEMKDVPEEDLRALKVGYRAKTFIKTAQFFSQETDYEYILRRLSKEEADRQLRRIYGVGPATAWYLLFEKLHHYDAFDTISPWERKIMAGILFGEPDASAEYILHFTRERWGKWRMLAVHYLFEDLFSRHQEEEIDWLSVLMHR